MEFVKDNSRSSGKWCQPCTITLKMMDADHATQLANALNELLSKAAQGGDFALDGHHIGHDVQVQALTLVVGNVAADLK